MDNAKGKEQLTIAKTIPILSKNHFASDLGFATRIFSSEHENQKFLDELPAHLTRTQATVTKLSPHLQRHLMDLSKFIDYPLWVRIAGILWLASSFALGYALLFSRPIRKEERIPDAQLVAETKQLAQRLFAFCNQRQANQPDVDNRDWRLLAYSSETNNLYDARFKARVLSALEEFSERNLIIKDFDRSWAEHPTNYIALSKVASALDELALKLELSIK